MEPHEAVMNLRGYNRKVKNLRCINDSGAELTYNGSIHIIVRPRATGKVPPEYIELLTDRLIRNNNGQITRVYADAQDIVTALEDYTGEYDKGPNNV